MFQSSSTTEAVLDLLRCPSTVARYCFNPRARPKPCSTSRDHALRCNKMFQSSSTTEAVLDVFASGLVAMGAEVSILEHDRSRARPAARGRGSSRSTRFNPRARPKPCSTGDEGASVNTLIQFQSSSTTEAVLDRRSSTWARSSRMFQSSSTTEAVLDVLVDVCDVLGIGFQSSSTTEAVLDSRGGVVTTLEIIVSILEHDRSRARRGRACKSQWRGSVSILEHDRSRARRSARCATRRGRECFNPRARPKPCSTALKSRDRLISRCFNPRARPKPCSTGSLAAFRVQNWFQSSSTTEAVLDEAVHHRRTARVIVSILEHDRSRARRRSIRNTRRSSRFNPRARPKPCSTP